MHVRTIGVRIIGGHLCQFLIQRITPVKSKIAPFK